MMDLAESSRSIDIITLVEELEQKKDLQAVGDVGYISSLVDGVPDRPLDCSLRQDCSRQGHAAQPDQRLEHSCGQSNRAG